MRMLKYVLLVMLSIPMMSCATIGMDEDEEAVSISVSILARRVGAMMAERNPDDVDTIISFIQAFKGVEDDDKTNILDAGIKYLVDEYVKDPLLRADLIDLGALLNIQISDGVIEIIGEIDWDLINAALTSFQEGIKMGVQS